ncbi:MAG TPA: arylamine N-acetyltransferase [Devosia sp.]|nr:arylamine N-acetyltransferase [Devosia sp.]
MSQKVNLKAYFDRIGFAGSIAPTLATLEAIHALHPAAIPFENLNPLLGLPVKLELDSIGKKLLQERRGGYCYEHNLLLMAVLRELDFNVRALAARVLWSDPNTTQSHHMLLAVEIGGATYIADVGFGGLSLTAPLKLKSEVEQPTPHEMFRLVGGQPEWQLEARIDDAWKVLYAFTTEARQPEDFAQSNLYLAGDPQSGFRQELRVALSPPGKRLALRDTRFAVHEAGQPSIIRQLETVEALREVLTTSFGLQLPAAEIIDPLLERIIAKAVPQES